MRAAIVWMLLTVVGLTLAPAARAQQKRGNPKKQGTQTEQLVGFSVSDRQIVVEFFREHPYEAKALPPGIAKNLRRGKPLPPGIAKKQVPAALQARLSTRAGVEITIFGDRIVLLEASGLVVDILEGIFD